MSDEKLLPRARRVLREEGAIAFLRKSLNYIFRSIPDLDLRLLSSMYVWGFRRVYVYRGAWDKARWLGVQAIKSPTDLWIYQEIIWQTRPDFIIETGSGRGGSALFMASICELIGRGMVITIDVDDKMEVPHPRIIRIVGDSISEYVERKVEQIVGDKAAMVVLDSDHKKEHVLREMEIYSRFVRRGNYLVAEDTSDPKTPSPGPLEAVREFLSRRDDFIVDRDREKFMLTFFSGGFLKKIK